MAKFKKKNYLKVGDIKLPRPPRNSSHIKILCAGRKSAIVAIKDVDTLLGTEGKLQYLRLNLKTKRLMETHAKKYMWNGKEVTGYKFDE